MVKMAMFNVQRAVTPKIGKPELWFMCSACSIMVLYICVKFRENITNGRVMERIRVYGKIGYVQCSKDNTVNVLKFQIKLNNFSSCCLKF